jgi:GrpB-like predicted nucleotidyltransferase (UPF0157 family)
MIELAPYDPQWAARYETERARIAAVLGETAERIEHIGSTAVLGLAAKPVVDILVALTHPQDGTVRAALESAGYMLHVDEPAHRMFRTPQMDVHVHLWASDSDDVTRHLLFRDWLRAHAEDRALYEHVKRKLAEREWRDRNDYAQAKTPVISGILRRARGAAQGPRIANFGALLLSRLPERANVLEIGAGEGELAQMLADAGHNVTALDRGLRSRFPIVEATFEEYDAGDTRFDCIAAQYVLHHADDLEGMLSKIHALLKPGGFIAIDDYGWERSDDVAFRNDRSDLHTSETMLAQLRSHFRETYYAEHAYADDGAGTDLMAFTYLGTKRCVSS